MRYTKMESMMIFPISCFPCAAASTAFAAAASHLRPLALCFSSSCTCNYMSTIRTKLKYRKLPRQVCVCVCVCA